MEAEGEVMKIGDRFKISKKGDKNLIWMRRDTGKPREGVIVGLKKPCYAIVKRDGNKSTVLIHVDFIEVIK